ncbi:MAG TPA: PQQ-binding-like beta-propeller repeat protein, partial [Rhizomicrobium sp.]|nr:PQQ-binding-like beta-propeller repeat protein [Rhizomicrobium sp.]
PKPQRPSTYRGVSYWPGDAGNAPRIIATTTDGKIFALDAKTGALVGGFGDNGMIDMHAQLTEKFPTQAYGFTTPPAVYKDLIIFGPRVGESAPNAKGPDAAIRALDVRTGREVWNFHTLPRPGEVGYDSWGPDFWKDGAGPSAWAGIAVDEKRGMVFVPVGNVSGGGAPASRKGNNLFANSVVALNANTGKLIWYYQMVHHDEWDYDVTAPPSLVDVVQNGKKIPAVAQVTKNGLLFILDRLTGKPLFGVDERTVPAGSSPDDLLSPTQPFPLKPPPLARQSMSPADVSKISPESESYCSGLVATHDHGGPFTPRGNPDHGRINFPSSIGGGNWGGVSFDPKLGLIFTNTSDLGSFSNGTPTAIAPLADEDAAARGAPGGGGRGPGGGAGGGRAPGGNRFVDQDHYPCNAPPWGTLTAINANTGDIAWQVPLGSYKALEAKGLTDIGAANVGGSLVTAGGVLFIGATNDQRFRAFDARTGKKLWQIDLDGDAQANPMTYLSRDGKQMLVVASGGDGLTGGVGPVQASVNGKIMAFTLPK